jgi:hypothetical protein
MTGFCHRLIFGLVYWWRKQLSKTVVQPVKGTDPLLSEKTRLGVLRITAPSRICHKVDLAFD